MPFFYWRQREATRYQPAMRLGNILAKIARKECERKGGTWEEGTGCVMPVSMSVSAPQLVPQPGATEGSRIHVSTASPQQPPVGTPMEHPIETATPEGPTAPGDVVQAPSPPATTQANSRGLWAWVQQAAGTIGINRDNTFVPAGKNAAVFDETARALSQPQQAGVPWWAWALGVAAVVGGAFALKGKRRRNPSKTRRYRKWQASYYTEAARQPHSYEEIWEQWSDAAQRRRMARLKRASLALKFSHVRRRSS